MSNLIYSRGMRYAAVAFLVLIGLIICATVFNFDERRQERAKKDHASEMARQAKETALQTQKEDLAKLPIKEYRVTLWDGRELFIEEFRPLRE